MCRKCAPSASWAKRKDVNPNLDTGEIVCEWSSLPQINSPERGLNLVYIVYFLFLTLKFPWMMTEPIRCQYMLSAVDSEQ